MAMSMTAYAADSGSTEGWSWTWEMRGVNGRGLDLRLRLPDWIEGLEAAIRPRLQKALARGSVTLSLRLAREAEGGELPEPATLDRALGLVRAVEARAAAAGLSMAPVRATDILAMRAMADGGAERPGSPTELTEAVSRALREHVLPAFLAMRASEGAAISALLGAQLDRVADLVETAQVQAEARRDAARAAMQAALARVMAEVAPVDPDRVAQELALIAVKSDVTEEIDRLRAHVDAARGLVGADGPVGRKLDFLMQEFNREANTLCAKAQDSALTATGLDLKTVIDQMREQVQNLE